MATFTITAPNGKKYRITGETSGGAVDALKKHLSAGASHPEFDGSSIPGYDPRTGMVGRSKSDSGVLAGLSSALEGIPILGPYLQSGSETAAAGIGSLISGQPYDQVRSEMSGMVDDSQRAHPVISTAAGIGGAVAGTLPMVLAAPAAFGASGSGLVARSIASGITGAGIGAVDSGVRSDFDPDAMRNGLIAGGVTGAAGPGIGRAIGAGWQGIRNVRANSAAAKAAGVNKSTLSTLNRAVRDDGLDPAAIASRMQELGPDAMLMDLGPNLQRQAGALAASPGRGQEIIRGGIAARDAGANARIRGAVDDTLGPAGIPSQIDDAIRSNQQVVGQAYEQAFRNARAVDTTPLAQNLESAAVNLRGAGQKAARDVRQMLNVIGTDQLDPNPYTLFQTRQAIDGMMATNADTNAIRVLSGARQQVDDMLSRSVPGIKEADAQFAELARQREALTRGQQVLDSGRTAPRPQELAQEVQQGALPQGRQIGPSAAPVRLRDGARAEIDRIVGTNANDRVALQRVIKGEGDWNRSRLATLFGQERADKIINVLDRERLFSETSNIVTRNSETAARTAAMKEITGETAPQFGVREGYMAGGLLGSARSAGVKAAESIKNSLTAANREATNSGLAKALASKDYDAVARALMRSQGTRKLNKDSVEKIARALMIGSGTASVRP